MTPRVAAIHDLSCFGRCSLTIVLPVLSAMGVQCCPLPTALLSTHTAFDGNTFWDAAAELEGVMAHWKALDLRFQGIYSGFLGSAAQIGLVRRFVKDFRRPDTLLIVDPVLGDHGVPYRTCTPDLCAGMIRLAEEADVITPNRTEAALLLGAPFETLRETPAEEVAERLSLGGRRSVVLTGCSAGPGQTGAVCFDRAGGTLSTVQAARAGGEFHGTGDLFAAVLTGALVQGRPLREAARQAAEFTALCAARTAEVGLPRREGLDFEPLLGRLVL